MKLLNQIRLTNKLKCSQGDRMKIHQIRNATIIITYNDKRFLIDPWLMPAGFMPGFEGAMNSNVKQPRVELPISADKIVDVDAVIEVLHTGVLDDTLLVVVTDGGTVLGLLIAAGDRHMVIVGECVAVDLALPVGIASLVVEGYAELVDDIDVFETHDCFTSSEYMAISAFGLTPPGKEYEAVITILEDAGFTNISTNEISDLPLNKISEENKVVSIKIGLFEINHWKICQVFYYIALLLLFYKGLPYLEP